MYNLFEYSKNYSKTSGSLLNYYRDELTDETNDDNGPNKNVINSDSFTYNTNITGSTYNVATTADGYDANKEGTKKVEITVLLKYLGNFWRAIDMLLFNCQLFLALGWSASCVITSIEKGLLTAAQGGNPAVHYKSPTNTAFKITDFKI